MVRPSDISFSSRASPEANFDDYVRISFSYYEADVLKAAMVKFSDLINSMLHESWNFYQLSDIYFFISERISTKQLIQDKFSL